MNAPIYTVTVTREGRYWVGKVEGLPGAAVETRRLSKLDDEVRYGLAQLLDLEPDSFELEFNYALMGMTGRMSRFQRARKRRDDAEQEYSKAAQDLARRLEKEHVSDRDAGILMGMSHANVQKVKAKGRPISRPS